MIAINISILVEIATLQFVAQWYGDLLEDICFDQLFGKQLPIRITDGVI